MRLLRISAIVAASGVLLLAFVQAAQGRYREALGACLVSLGGYLLVLFTWGAPAAQLWVAVAVIAVGFATSGLLLFALVALAVLFALVLLSVVLTLRFLGGLQKLEFEPVGPDAVMPGAERTVAEFEAHGFRRVGGYRAPIGTKLVTVSVLVGPNADRFADVTDVVVEVVSRFDGRFFITTNSTALLVPRDLLRQEVARGKPDRLIAAHEAALEVLARSSARPGRFATDTDVLEAARAVDERALGFLSDGRLRKVLRMHIRLRTKEPTLGDDEHSARRIESWLGAESHW